MLNCSEVQLGCVQPAWRETLSNALASAPLLDLAISTGTWCAGLILVTMAALRYGLTWSADAFRVLHHIMFDLKPEDAELIQRMDGIKLISNLMRPHGMLVLGDEACKGLGKRNSSFCQIGKQRRVPVVCQASHSVDH